MRRPARNRRQPTAAARRRRRRGEPDRRVGRRTPLHAPPIAPERRLSAMYDAFNERDMDTATAQMTADVNWPKAWEPGRTDGRDAVRDYWRRMWSAVETTVQPLDFSARTDGRIVVLVHRVVRDLDGRLLDERRTRHVFVLREDKVARMDVEEIIAPG